MTIADQISLQVNCMSDDKQSRVLEFARGLVERPAGLKLQSLRLLAGHFLPENLLEIEEAVEENCEQIDASNW